MTHNTWLMDTQRGRLNAQKDAITSPAFAQQWLLDATGNWGNFKQEATEAADRSGSRKAEGGSIHTAGTWNLDQDRTANKVNEITDITETTGPSWATPAYSLAGNMTTVPQPVDPTASYAAAFDAWNRLVQLTEGANTVQENEYDGLRRRTVRKDYLSGSLDETRHFYYSDSWQVLEERLDSSTDPDRQFVWGLRYIDDLACRARDTTGDGTLDERFYALQDANWNVTAIADAAGDVQERYAYQPYGQPLFLDSAFVPQSASSFNWETLFAGYRGDELTSLYIVRYRVLHPALGNWMQRDTWDSRRQLNLFSYLSPLNDTDPLGLCSLATLMNALALIDQYLEAAASLPFVFPLHPENPHQHCVWNCRMTRVMGPLFSAQMSWKKELIDNAFADLRDSLQADGCWCFLPLSIRDYIQDSADSAFQPSDFFDNAAGIVCGLTICDRFPWNDTSCEDCCTGVGIGPGAKEGPGTSRPFGPRSQQPRPACPGDPPPEPPPDC